ncbi:MAG: glycosyltransferase [Bacteroidota bacterium]|jgi:biofilm PGA synthesis N-glycosyltransferase PgaC
MIKLFSIVLLSMLFLYSIFYLGSAFIYFFSMRKLKNKSSYLTKFSIIIPARNEEKNITHILNDLSAQDYPKELYEIIVVDDESTDRTNYLAQKFLMENNDLQIKLISLKSNEYKKKGAIMSGIKDAANEIIITRDADTISNKNWLISISSFIEFNKADMYIAPVKLQESKTFFGVFQEMEHAVLQSSGGGMAILNRPYLCNGANLIFKKSQFEKLNGYEGNLQEASGDDIFLMEKFRKDSTAEISYIPIEEAAVTTFPLENLRDIIQQKIRWSGKFKLSASFLNSFSAFLFTFTHILFALSPIFFFKESSSMFFFVIFLSIKLSSDYLLLLLSHKKMDVKAILLTPVFSFFIPIYIILIFFSGLLNKKSWKGRDVD